MKIEAALAAFAPCSDRFVTGGYREELPLEEQIIEIAKIKGYEGIPVMYPLNTPNPNKYVDMLKQYNLRIGTVCPDIYLDGKQKLGTITSNDPGKRKETIRLIKDSVDFCHEVNGVDILLWFAHDGYDYPFEDDYETRWGYILEGLHEVVSYRSDVNITIEYKMKEPMTHQYISDIGKSLLICQELNLPNLGVVIDFGHALLSGENPAESVVLANTYKRLFHIHLNDNFRSMDDDLLLGSVNFWETLEFFYQLNKVNYDGWYVIDIWPSRVDGIQALQESVDRVNGFMNLAKTLPIDEFTMMQRNKDTMKIMKMLRESILR